MQRWLSKCDTDLAVSRFKYWGWRTDEIAKSLGVPEFVVANSMARRREEVRERTLLKKGKRA